MDVLEFFNLPLKTQKKSLFIKKHGYEYTQFISLFQQVILMKSAANLSTQMELYRHVDCCQVRNFRMVIHYGLRF